MLSNQSWNADLTARFSYPLDLIQLSYAPLAHTTDRKTSIICMINGGRFGIFNRDMKCLFEELQFLKPTVFTAPPRIWNEAYEAYLLMLSEVRQVRIRWFAFVLFLLVVCYALLTALRMRI